MVRDSIVLGNSTGKNRMRRACRIQYVHDGGQAIYRRASKVGESTTGMMGHAGHEVSNMDRNTGTPTPHGRADTVKHGQDKM